LQLENADLRAKEEENGLYFLCLVLFCFVATQKKKGKKEKEK